MTDHTNTSDDPSANTSPQFSEPPTSTDAVTADDSTVNLDSFGEEILPPPELPAEYLDDTRQSLSESDAYSEHLTEHWGF